MGFKDDYSNLAAADLIRYSQQLISTSNLNRQQSPAPLPAISLSPKAWSYRYSLFGRSKTCSDKKQTASLRKEMKSLEATTFSLGAQAGLPWPGSATAQLGLVWLILAWLGSSALAQLGSTHLAQLDLTRPGLTLTLRLYELTACATFQHLRL